jgi:hypothetical protein
MYKSTRRAFHIVKDEAAGRLVRAVSKRSMLPSLTLTER